MVVRNMNSPGAVSRRFTEPSGSPSPSSALSFLERSHRSESSSLPATWPAGFVPPPKTDRATFLGTSRSSTRIPRLPRTSALAFLERPPIRARGGGTSTSTSTNSLVTGAGAEAGLGCLSGGVMATGYGRGGFLPRAHSSIGGSGSEDSDELDELDSDICPSMLFSCFPCLSWFRYDGREGKRVCVHVSYLYDTVGGIQSAVVWSYGQWRQSQVQLQQLQLLFQFQLQLQLQVAGVLPSPLVFHLHPLH